MGEFATQFGMQERILGPELHQQQIEHLRTHVEEAQVVVKIKKSIASATAAVAASVSLVSLGSVVPVLVMIWRAVF